MKNIMMVLLEGIGGEGLDNWGMELFIVAIVAFIAALISFIASTIDKMENSPFVKIGLICLLIAGVCLLLTSFLCSWWG